MLLCINGWIFKNSSFILIDSEIYASPLLMSRNWIVRRIFEEKWVIFFRKRTSVSFCIACCRFRCSFVSLALGRVAGGRGLSIFWRGQQLIFEGKMGIKTKQPTTGLVLCRIESHVVCTKETTTKNGDPTWMNTARRRCNCCRRWRSGFGDGRHYRNTRGGFELLRPVLLLRS